LTADASLNVLPNSIVVNRFRGDAERAFAHILPAGSQTPAGVNPGKIYQALRAVENPENCRKEADLLFMQANKFAEELLRSSNYILYDLQQKASRLRDMVSSDRKRRDSAIAMAWDLPRSLVGMQNVLSMAHRRMDLRALRRALYAICAAEVSWRTMLHRLADTPPHPLDIWCARVPEMRQVAEGIRRGMG
jgi:hypothetical protein